MLSPGMQNTAFTRGRNAERGKNSMNTMNRKEKKKVANVGV